MATFEVSTWDDLKSKVAEAAEGDTVYLTADIDMNAVYPEGLPREAQITTGSSNKDVYIDGGSQHHKIKNLYIRSLEIHDTVTAFSSVLGSYNHSPHLFINNVDFENVVLDWTKDNPPKLFYGTKCTNCRIAITMINNSNSTSGTFAFSEPTCFDSCALTLQGIKGSTYAPNITIGASNSNRSSWCNINLLGDFHAMTFSDVCYSYIQGKINSLATGSSSFCLYTTASIINATINFAAVPPATAGNSLTLINTDGITLPSGSSLSDLPSDLIQVTTAELHSVSALQLKGFPIR